MLNIQFYNCLKVYIPSLFTLLPAKVQKNLHENNLNMQIFLKQSIVSEKTGSFFETMQGNSTTPFKPHIVSQKHCNFSGTILHHSIKIKTTRQT